MSTYVPIQAISVSAGTTSVNFTGIPQTFTDLIIVANLRGNSTNTATGIRFNSDTATNYSLTGMSGEGASPISYRNTSSDRILAVSGSANWNTNWGTILINVMNYTNTTTTKTVLIRSGVATGETVAHVGLWRKSPVEAITSVTVVAVSGSWGADSTFTLYGIGSGAPKAFGGDEVRTDGTYWYHIFRSSGRFEPVQSLSNVDFLVIAGGGGGGRGDVNNNGGGGGAGGYRTSAGASGGGAAAQSKLTLSPQSYVVTIGAGGNGGASDYTRGSNGSSSSFSTVSTTGGGGGGAVNASPSGKGLDGGSGGGSGDFNNAYTGGAGTANEGFDGGSGVGAQGTSRNMGGGGGAGGAGGSYVTQTGGAGVASDITGTSVTRAVGGNGSNAGGSASANTGSGGNGNRSSAAGNGGSGIVVIRYAV